MLKITLDYIPFSSKVGFLRIKQWVFKEYPGWISNSWFIMFYTHILTSIFVLIAGFTQFSKRLMRTSIHRKIGKLYIGVILFLAGPSGLIMGLLANGGIISQLAFVLLSILWMSSTYFAYRFAVKGAFKQHEYMMILSFSLTISALTLRAWKFTITNYTDLNLNPTLLYQIVAWLGWAPNLLVGLIIVKRKKDISTLQNAKNIN